LLYKATEVPVGEDQKQHLEFTHAIIRTLNSRYGRECFPMAQFIPSSFPRVKSLRDPSKKMSKSDPDSRSRIEISDSAEEMRKKISLALSDFVSDVFYEPVGRPAISNLMTIHHMITGKSLEKITEEAVGINTAKYKKILAEDLVKKFGPISEKFHSIRKNEEFLWQILEEGSAIAAKTASRNMHEMKSMMGLR
jgi:tryptophanyl-tRNA synthetase